MLDKIKLGSKAKYIDIFGSPVCDGVIIGKCATPSDMVLFVIDNNYRPGLDAYKYFLLTGRQIDFWKGEQITLLSDDVNSYIGRWGFWKHPKYFTLLTNEIIDPNSFCAHCKLQTIHTGNSLCEFCATIQAIS